MESTQEFIVNPITGRKLKVGSNSYLKLMRDLDKMNSANADLTGMGVKLKPVKKEPTTIRIYDHNDEDEYASSANEDAVLNLMEKIKVPTQKKEKNKEESKPKTRPSTPEPEPEPEPAPEPEQSDSSDSSDSYESSSESEHDDYVESSESDTDEEFIGLIESFM